MRALLLFLLVSACVSAEQQESSLVSSNGPTEGKLDTAKKLPDRAVEVPENGMAEFMERLGKYEEEIRSKLAPDPEQRKVLQESLKSFKRNTVDIVEPRVLSAEEVNMENGKAAELYQGDIVLSKEQQSEILSEIGGARLKRQAYTNASFPGHWEKRAVSYRLNNTLSKRGKSAFRKAAKYWHTFTCINITEIPFEEDEDEDETEDEHERDGDKDEEGDAEEGDSEYDDSYYYYYDGQVNGNSSDELGLELEDYEDFDLITVNPGNYCGSSIGKQPLGWQHITLGRKCETIGTAAHELGHALGFWHTQARHDRDEYITLNWDNIDGNYTSEFVKQTNESNDNYGLPYDYGSVMHYRATAASTNGKPTVVPKDGLYTQTLGSLLVSFYDIFMMNKHYNCTDSCSKDEHYKCKNHGFAHPRNCSKCICPSGYGGDFCNQRPNICGEELNVTGNWTQLITANSSAMTQGGEDGYKRCIYWLKAPNGSNVEVRLTKLPENVTADGCIYAGVEIKARQDQGLTGYRFCSKDDVNTTLISNSSTVPVISYMRRRRNDTVTELEYRIAEQNSRDGKSEDSKA